MRTMKEWVDRKKKESETEGVYNPYGGWERCIVVTRLSKEGSKAKRLKRMSEAKGRDVEEDELQDSIIVKPLNVMFLDRSSLNNETFPASKPDVMFVDVFIDLVTLVREYVFMDRIQEKHKLDYMDKNGMLGVTDELAEYFPRTSLSWIQNTTRDVGTYAKSVFPFIKKNQGTHILRKIYMTWAYNSYAKNTMKETGFASEALGHKGFQVSLNYTSLILKQSIVGDVTNIEVMREKFHQLSKRISKLEKMLNHTDAKDESTVTIEGREYTVLPRAKRGTDHVARAAEKIKELEENGVVWTWKILQSLNVNTAPATKKAINDMRAKE